MATEPGLEPKLESLAEDIAIKLLELSEARKDFLAAIAENESYKELARDFKIQSEPLAKIRVRSMLHNLGVSDAMPELEWRPVLVRAFVLLDELEYGT